MSSRFVSILPFLGIFLVGILLVPGIVGEVNSQSSNTGDVVLNYQPNSFSVSGQITMGPNSSQDVNLLKPIADLLTESNTSGVFDRENTRSLSGGTITIIDQPNSFYSLVKVCSGNSCSEPYVPKPLADLLTESNVAGMYARDNPMRTLYVGLVEITDIPNSADAKVKIWTSENSAQEHHVIKPLADLLNDSQFSSYQWARSETKTFSTLTSDTTPPVISIPDALIGP